MVDTYETIGKVLAGEATHEELDAMSHACLPTAGACAGQFTANTMGMVSEALGLAPIGSSMVPAVFSERAPLMRRAAKALMAAVMKSLDGGGPLPRDVVTRKALENACALVSATGGSTNAALHLPAIAHEAGIRFHLDDVAEVFARTPLIADLRPGGKYLARDVYYIGGAGVVLRELMAGGFVHGDALTFTGRTLAEELASANAPDGRVVREIAQALSPGRRPRRAQGQPVPGRRPAQDRRPEGADAPRAGTGVRIRRRSTGCGAGHALPARRRDRDPQRRTQGQPRHARDAGHHRAALRPGHGRQGGAADRRPLLGRHARLCIGYAGPEAADGGPIAALRDGDMVSIDARAAARSISVELGGRRDRAAAERNFAAPAMRGGLLEKYALTVRPGHQGAVTHSGAVTWLRDES